MLAHHFDDLQQQHEASIFGMWVFLVTEVLFFGGVFAAYMVYRSAAPDAFGEGSRHLDIVLGTVNTVVLLGSSLTMALAVSAAHDARPKLLVRYLLGTLALGLVFLGIKFMEYYHKYEDGYMPLLGLPFRYEGPDAGEVQIFYSLYFAMTGLHAVHMIIGIGLLAFLIAPSRRGRYSGVAYTPIEVMGMYWHFVDIVWIYLFPLLYLVDRT